MYLQNWEPLITEYRAHGYPTQFRLSFQARLECPICHEVIEKKTDAHVLCSERYPAEAKDPRRAVKSAIEDLRKTTKCPKCGVLSGLPNHDGLILTEEVVDKVTEEWIKKEIQSVSKGMIKIV